MAQPGKAAVSKTAGANLGSSNLSLGAILITLFVRSVTQIITTVFLHFLSRWYF